MKLFTIFFLLTFSFVTAQENALINNLKETSIVTKDISLLELNAIDFIVDDKVIAKKKSYKYIIENTLSGRKNLIFKTKRSTKIC